MRHGAADQGTADWEATDWAAAGWTASPFWMRLPEPGRSAWKPFPVGRPVPRSWSRDRAALEALRFNIAACAGAQARVVAADVLRPPLGVPCDLVFLDPPYEAGLLPRATAALAASGWLAADALLVAESSRAEQPQLGDLLAERDHGAGRISFWRLNAAASR